MPDTQVSVLTPAGTGAIASIAVVGPEAWPVVRSQFRPVNDKALTDQPAANQLWLGTLGYGSGDEAVVALKTPDPTTWIEVHCHGGRRVVRWVVEQFVSIGCIEVDWNRLPKPTRGNGWACDPRALGPLTRSPTLRTASILLDQYHGAFRQSITDIIEALDREDHDDASSRLHALADLAPVGRHLAQPWQVVVAGAPNVGKSSLVNALAGYQRTIVAPVAGTTRDVVTVTVAFDGWPVELADTAGLRHGRESLEVKGIERARRFLSDADLVVRVMDGSDPKPIWIDDSLPGRNVLTVINKSDQPNAWSITDWGDGWGLLCVSALTGSSIPELAAEIMRKIIRTIPSAGVAVPFTPELADAVEAAHRLLATGEVAAARKTLASCLPEG